MTRKPSWDINPNILPSAAKMKIECTAAGCDNAKAYARVFHSVMQCLCRRASRLETTPSAPPTVRRTARKPTTRPPLSSSSSRQADIAASRGAVTSSAVRPPAYGRSVRHMMHACMHRRFLGHFSQAEANASYDLSFGVLQHRGFLSIPLPS